MKNIVINDDFLAGELKPSDLLKEYLGLVAEEIPAFFPAQDLKAVACPACAHASDRRQFQKLGLTYHECAQCLTLYVSPRPTDLAITRFYKTSKARSFWNERLYSKTAGVRQEKIIEPRFQWMEDSTTEYLPNAQHYADLNANQRGYLPQIAQLSVFKTKTLINPLIPLAPQDIPAGIKMMEALQGPFDVVSLFEALDHTSDVSGLLKQLHRSLSPGGLCFITGILGSGFDIKMLEEFAQNLHPPDRLNAFSVDGLKKLLRQNGFECLEFSTPGILDVDLVAKGLKENKQVPISAFMRNLITQGSAETKRSFQDFLQANLLSSYGRILIRKAN